MSESEGYIQEPHDEERLEEEEAKPSDILQPSLLDDLVQQGVVPQRSVQKGNSMRYADKVAQAYANHP